MRVVIIEDSRTQAERLRLLLESQGYQVDVAADGQEGMAACQRDPLPHAVISDVVMPTMDGYEFARRLKGDPRTADVPLMLITTLDRPEVVFRAVASGADNFIGKPYSDDKLLVRLKRMIDGARPTPTGVLIHDNNGTIHIEATPSRLASLLHSALEDATDRAEQLERHRSQLEQANHQHQALMRLVAHELRTPLSTLSVRAKLETLASGSDNDPQSLASVVARNVSRMVRIIDDLVDASNIDLGTLTADRQTIDIIEVARSAVDEARLMAPQHQVALKAPTRLEVHGDPRRLEQVIVNFLTNAIKYSPRGSTISVLVEVAAGVAKVAVSDHGIGLSESDQARVFDRYFRAGPGQQQAEGMGLGLHVCKHIIMLHGGRIGVQSELGQGSTFWFSLPAA
jgi:two-component system, sensor histidine kinase and response regulator